MGQAVRDPGALQVGDAGNKAWSSYSRVPTRELLVQRQHWQREYDGVGLGMRWGWDPAEGSKRCQGTGEKGRSQGSSPPSPWEACLSKKWRFGLVDTSLLHPGPVPATTTPNTTPRLTSPRGLGAPRGAGGSGELDQRPFHH